jgi:hypothetical protein
MFAWYRNSDICYAYLADVPELYSVCAPNWGGVFDVKGYFKNSRWFTRGWTLQELIAPRVVEFYTADWSPIGSKEILQEVIASITGIHFEALMGDNLANFNVAERMSWAASRNTSRLEDKAYCLFGIFQVHIPLLYGEGERAFVRLQEEILRSTQDYSIFLWGAAQYSPKNYLLGGPDDFKNRSLLASHPTDFYRRTDIGWRYSDLVQVLEHDTLLQPGAPDNPDLLLPSISGGILRVNLPLALTDLGDYLAFPYYELPITGEWICISLKIKGDTRKTFTRNWSKSHGIHFEQMKISDLKFEISTIFIALENPEAWLPRKDPGNWLLGRIWDLMHKGTEGDTEKLTNAEELANAFEKAYNWRKRLWGSHGSGQLFTLQLLGYYNWFPSGAYNDHCVAIASLMVEEILENKDLEYEPWAVLQRFAIRHGEDKRFDDAGSLRTRLVDRLGVSHGWEEY